MNAAAGARIVLRHELTRVTLALSAITVVVTFPLAARITDALPGDLGDPLLNCFILAWGASRMPFAVSGVWTAPFYFPLKDTLALSEHLLGITVFTAPVQWTTGNQVLAHNLAFLGSYVLAGVGMYLLARALWGRKDAAFLAALAFAFAPHRVMHIPHLQVLFSGWMPIGLWGLHRYFQTGSWRALGVFAGAYALLALSNGYFLYFFAVPVAVVAAGGLIRASVVARGPLRLCANSWRSARPRRRSWRRSRRWPSPTSACGSRTASAARLGRLPPSAPSGPTTSGSPRACGPGPAC
jgi:energy-converting hydrogenase Eha subunit A